MEIERKYLIRELPKSVTRVKAERIKQGYIAHSRDKEVRLRQKGRSCYLTVKSKGDLSRDEYEIPLSKRQFMDLWPATCGLRLEKERGTIPYHGVKLEIDTYSGDLDGLITGETEFSGLEQAARFPPPDYFLEELTFDARFKNLNLASLSPTELTKLVPANKDEPYPLIGGIPYLFQKEKLRVVMVTSKTSGFWIFPKGQPIDGKTSSETALLEAFEEAGVKASIRGNPIVIPYDKTSGQYSMLLYPMEVKSLEKSWPESRERERDLFSIEQAREVINKAGLVSALDYLQLLTASHS